LFLLSRCCAVTPSHLNQRTCAFPARVTEPRRRHHIPLSRAAETAPLQTTPDVVNYHRAQHTLLLCAETHFPPSTAFLPHVASMPRPLRLLLSLTTSLLAVTLLLYVTLGGREEQKLEGASHAPKQSSVKALFSFTSPGSLFPPSAIISLTDDNSTFFLARPADFGPVLPGDGLSGPLWIGSGFGDDALSRGGELGCSDIPGWDGGSELLPRTLKTASTAKSRRTGPLAEKKDKPRKVSTREDDALPSNDGTDDHLHQTLDQVTRHSSDHADIQSLQESAEIAGKVVLLQRGGCGFLAKVEWAQRRGAVAVVVGDNVRGGALIRMYARGDTSNVTIPSVFTSHTTAHLLSSLLPSGKILAGTVPSQQKGEPTPSGTTPQATSTPSTGSQGGPLAFVDDKPAEYSWLHSLLTGLGLLRAKQEPTDTFRIGEDDWRDPKFRNLPTTTLPTNTPTLTPSSSTVSGSRHRVETKYTAPNSEHKASWRSWLGVSRRSVTSITSANSQEIDNLPGEIQPHEGLWVTLTPTNVSSSPFFDTLLVLVVSPLVTLSVVYALLLLRSRIRRRRWRAPKSVVERLPVRTYHTISDSSSSPSASSEAATPTTPLLQRSPPRPATSTPSASQDEPEAPATSSSVQRTTRDREEEKRETGLAEWRRRYGGRQKECVVCLEEYVDGVSQVMSLPCGHEFHVDCM
jgi:hypothetical protein